MPLTEEKGEQIVKQESEPEVVEEPELELEEPELELEPEVVEESEPEMVEESEPEVVEESEPEVGCPCIVKTKEGPKRCGRKIKEFGVCGLHRTKCMRVEEPPSLTPPTAPDMGCPCIIISRKGEKKACGRVIKEHGACGIHQHKCVQPDGTVVDPAGQPRISPIERRAKTPRVESAETCPCIIKGKKGNPDKICGRKAKVNGRCLLHERSCQLPDAAPSAVSTFEEEPELEVDVQVPRASPELKEPEPAREISDWKINSVSNLDDVYKYLVDVPEEMIDLGDQVLLTDAILTYLTA